MQLNMLLYPKIWEWLSDEQSIFRPKKYLSGLCEAFLLLKEPKELKKRLEEKEPEKPQRSTMTEMIENGMIDKNVDELPDSLSDYKL